MIGWLERQATIIHSKPGEHPRPVVSAARAALARLRRGAGKRPGEAIEAFRYVVEFLPDEESERTHWEREAFFVTATLFALHPTERGAARPAPDPGALFKQLGGHDSAEKRFVALLNCRTTSLAWHLRQAVQLARAAGVAVDYRRWLGDVLDWNHPQGRERAQMRWARSYWRTENPEDPKSGTTPDTDPKSPKP